MRLLASNLQTKVLASGATEELVKHIDALVDIGWADPMERNNYIKKFPALTNANVRLQMQTPVVRETMVQAVEVAEYFRHTHICFPKYIDRIIRKPWAEVSNIKWQDS